MTPSPLVRAVVVNWNGAHLLDDCLRSLLEQDLAPGELEVVVVDNASTDGSVALLEERYPDVRVVVNSTNRGFAGGVDSGLLDVTARYVALLNNDATFAPDALRRMIEDLDGPGNEDVGAVTAHMVLVDPDPAGRVLVNSTGNVLTRTGSAGDRDWLAVDGTVTPDRDVFGFCGGAALLRTATLADVGGFDDRLFLYYEDTDLSWRMRARGWRVVYEPRAVAHHQHSASSGSSSPLFRYYNTRNSLVVFSRHAPAAVVVASFVRQLAGAVRHSALRTEPADLVRARWRALRDALRLLPGALDERRRTWRGARARRADVFALGTRR
ncbi:glycosyltransferase family 2 protein [Oerskovia paurometabola]|uniref:glycosyltransferase family 2 protein n=1 Tax=Oerskovia paurometabola TaxID=162170 RepID=UPI0038053A6E